MPELTIRAECVCPQHYNLMRLNYMRTGRCDPTAFASVALCILILATTASALAAAPRVGIMCAPELQIHCGRDALFDQVRGLARACSCRAERCGLRSHC